jgi:hypothetical protein
MSHRRIARGRAWLSLRDPAEELLIIGTSLDAANELARGVVQTGRSVFGWHRFSLAQLAVVLAAPTMAERHGRPRRSLKNLSRLKVEWGPIWTPAH